MPKPGRVTLIDPMLYQSTYVNNQIYRPIDFWKKFHFWNFLFNIVIPIIVVVIILFILKRRYIHHKKR